MVEREQKYRLPLEKGWLRSDPSRTFRLVRSLPFDVLLAFYHRSIDGFDSTKLVILFKRNRSFWLDFKWFVYRLLKGVVSSDNQCSVISNILTSNL